MHKRDKTTGRKLLATAILAPGLILCGIASAQSGRIVCWKDNAGKVIGCGDKVPPEYQSSATRELDSRGIMRKQTESVDEANRHREKEQELARWKLEEERKALSQKRQDTALLETYASEKEIDLKRARDLQTIDLQIEQLTGVLQSTTQRHSETQARADAVEKNKKPLSPALKEELTRVTQEKQRIEGIIEAKQKEKEELRVRYSEYRRRYTELRTQQGGRQAAAAASARK